MTSSHDLVAVGDLNSDQIGSGARKNGGKPQLDLIPVRYWLTQFTKRKVDVEQSMHWYKGLNALQSFQEGNDYALLDFLATVELDDAVKVFEFGAQKYAAWNWAKGMAWSICFGCCLRHAQAALWYERAIDPDSGESHWGHFLCNLIMLDWYVDHYPEGDDRPLFRRADGPGMGL